MPGLVSVELLDSEKGAINGIASLDGTGKIPLSQLPPGSVETYKGIFATSALLITAYPSGAIADYAWIVSDNAFWYWSGGLVTPAWVKQTITVSAYNALTVNAKAAVPYIVIP